MQTYTTPLDHLRVAAPCPADWERMSGNERVRFCGECQLNVYNLSGMSRREAEALITSTEGRLCVRFYRRADGKILTRNCPVGLRAIKRRASRLARAAISGVLGFFAGLGFNFALGEGSEPPVPPRSGIMESAVVTTGPVSANGPVMGRPAMGLVAVTPQFDHLQGSDARPKRARVGSQ